MKRPSSSIDIVGTNVLTVSLTSSTLSPFSKSDHVGVCRRVSIGPLLSNTKVYIARMTGVSDHKTVFFGSDSEEERGQIDMDFSVASVSNSKKRLFVTSSDDERDQIPANVDDIIKRRTKNANPSPSVVALSPPLHAASSSLSVHSSSSPPPPKKRNAASPVPKKRKVSQPPLDVLPSISQVAGFESAYLGTFLVPNAWSTVKGRDWVKAGEEIHIRRNEWEGISARSNQSSLIKPDKKGSGKQLKLTSMMKAKEKEAPKAAKKMKVDNVVRFTNSRKFGKW